MRFGIFTACAIICGIVALVMLIFCGAHLSQGDLWNAARAAATGAMSFACAGFCWISGEEDD